MDAQPKSLSLFQDRPVESAILSREVVEYRPIGILSEGSPIEFNLPGNSMQYLDLANSTLAVQVKVVHSINTPLVDVDKVTPVNLLFHALFRQIDLSIQQKLLTTDVGVNYPYLALFQVLTEGGSDSLPLNKLQSEFFFKDTPGHIDSTDFVKDENKGLVSRHAISRLSQSFTMEGPIRLPIVNQDRPILNGVQVSIKLYPTSSEFRLMSEEESPVKVDIDEIVFKASYLTLNPKVVVAHDQALSIGNALYHFDQASIKTFNIAGGSYSFVADNLFNGRSPADLLIALVESESYSGSYDKSYANFAHFGVTDLTYSIDGKNHSFEPKFSESNATAEFLSLYQRKKPGKYYRSV